MHISDRSTMFLFQPQLNVQLVATKSALHFFDPTSLPVKCHIDEEEWVRIIQIIVGPCSCSPSAPGPSPLFDHFHNCRSGSRRVILFCTLRYILQQQCFVLQYHSTISEGNTSYLYYSPKTGYIHGMDAWSNAYLLILWLPFIIGLLYDHPHPSCSRQFAYECLGFIQRVATPLLSSVFVWCNLYNHKNALIFLTATHFNIWAA